MEPTRIHEDKEPVQQPHCPIDELVAEMMPRLLTNSEEFEAAIAELIGAVGPAITSDSDPEEHNWVRLAMYGRHLGDHLHERVATALSDAMIRQFEAQYGFTRELQERYGHAVLLADGTIGQQVDLGGGMFANIGFAEPGDNYDEEFNPLPGGVFFDPDTMPAEGFAIGEDYSEEARDQYHRDLDDPNSVESLRRRAHREGSTNADPH